MAEGQLSAEPIAVDSSIVIGDLLWLAEETDRRCLYDCSKWCRETLVHMPETNFAAYASVQSTMPPVTHRLTTEGVEALQHANCIEFARSLILNKEYRRAKFFLERIDLNNSVDAFLYYFSWYMISIQRRCETDSADTERREPFIDTDLCELRHDFERFKRDSAHLFDSFLHYLYALILCDCESKEEARDMFYEAVNCDHRCWPAWDGLAKLSDIFYLVKIEKIPDISRTWQCALYIGETFFRLQLFLCAMDKYKLVNPLGTSPYLLCQIASAQSELQEHDSAISTFQRVRKLDPFRVEQMDKFSDSLYIRHNSVELANLVKFFYANRKYTWETCFIVANYYSARGGTDGHDTAQLFLRRALRMNPTNTAIWVLLGHELMELTRNQSAVMAYQRAIVIDPLCYQAWYGLGQLYEILKLPAMALYYYQQAHKCKPADSRMLIALGVILTRLNRVQDAEKCFKKAFQIGDVEGNALTHLAQLYENQKDYSTAAKAYEAYIGFYNEDMVGDPEQIAIANQFLAKYYLEREDLDTAYTYAQKCLNYNTSKEEGYRILRTVMNRRTLGKPKSSATTAIAAARAAGASITDITCASSSTAAARTPMVARRRTRSSTSATDSSLMQVDDDEASGQSPEIAIASADDDAQAGDEYEQEDDYGDEDGDDNMNTDDDDDIEITY